MKKKKVKKIKEDNKLPSYHIHPRILNPVLNKKDTLRFEIFVFGHGKINQLETYINISFPLGYLEEGQRKNKLLWDKNVGEFRTLHSVEDNKIIKTIIKLSRFHVDAGRFLILPPIVYEKSVIGGVQQIAVVKGSGMVTTKEEYTPMIEVELEIPEHMPSGDHKIKFFYFYNDFQRWYVDEKELIFHVKTKDEQHPYRHAIKMAVIVIIVTAIASFTWQVFRLLTLFLLEYFDYIFHK